MSFNEWEEESELVFYMCLLRAVTWGAARHGGDVSDRGTLFRAAWNGWAHRNAIPESPLWSWGRELEKRPPPQRACFRGQRAGLPFQVNIIAQTKGFSSGKD